MHGTICSAVAVGLQNDNTPRGIASCAQFTVYRVTEGENASINAVIYALDNIRNKLENGIQKLMFQYLMIAMKTVKMKYVTKLNYSQKWVLHLWLQQGIEVSIKLVRAFIPACFNNVISVGALDRYRKKALFMPPVN